MKLYHFEVAVGSNPYRADGVNEEFDVRIESTSRRDAKRAVRNMFPKELLTIIVPLPG